MRAIALWAALFVALALLVQARLLEPWDEATLLGLSAFRSEALTEPMNWVFRLGFAQVDAVLALLWAGALLVRTRSVSLAAAPLVLFVAIALQAGLRLGIDQPAPGKDIELNRPFAAQPAEAVLDRGDAALRASFYEVARAPAAVAPPEPARERGSFPSGHSCRALFLALLAWEGLRRPAGGAPMRRLIVACLGALAGLVGYSAMYFGYHWPSDVLGGYLLALAVYPMATWLWGRGRAPLSPAG